MKSKSLRTIEVKMKTRAEADYRIEEDKDLGRQRSKEYTRIKENKDR